MASAEILAAGLEEGRAKQVSACIASDEPAPYRYFKHQIHFVRIEETMSDLICCLLVVVELGSREAIAMGPRHEEGAESPRNDQPRWQRQSGLFQAQEGALLCLRLLPVQPAVVRCCTLLTPHASGLQVVLVEDRKWGPEERDLLYQVDFTWQKILGFKAFLGTCQPSRALLFHHMTETCTGVQYMQSSQKYARCGFRDRTKPLSTGMACRDSRNTVSAGGRRSVLSCCRAGMIRL